MDKTNPTISTDSTIPTDLTLKVQFVCIRKGESLQRSLNCDMNCRCLDDVHKSVPIEKPNTVFVTRSFKLQWDHSYISHNCFLPTTISLPNKQGDEKLTIVAFLMIRILIIAKLHSCFYLHMNQC